MADDPSTSPSSERRGGSGRGPRTGAPRGEGGRGEGGRGEGGGFRIRLSDNEMQAARALQDAFGLRSTVAVLGFSLRTLAQQLEQGQLDALISEHRAQAGSRPQGGERRDGRRDGAGPRAGGGGGGRARVDPFARPSRPAAAPVDEPAPEDGAAEPESATAEAGVETLPLSEAEGSATTPPESDAPVDSPAAEAAPAADSAADDALAASAAQA
ncbi:MAG: hypothetical protein VKK62_09640 [Synechococcaceae cyanobacterium]|nr:hypothetical protein [Synechococcaceae cyanobacterium]